MKLLAYLQQRAPGEDWDRRDVRETTLREPGDTFDEDIVWHELVRTNDAVLVIRGRSAARRRPHPHLVLDQNMSVLEGSIGILPRRILVDECCIARPAGCSRRPDLATSFVPMRR